MVLLRFCNEISIQRVRIMAGKEFQWEEKWEEMLLIGTALRAFGMNYSEHQVHRIDKQISTQGRDCIRIGVNKIRKDSSSLAVNKGESNEMQLIT